MSANPNLEPEPGTEVYFAPNDDKMGRVVVKIDSLSIENLTLAVGMEFDIVEVAEAMRDRCCKGDIDSRIQEATSASIMAESLRRAAELMDEIVDKGYDL